MGALAISTVAPMDLADLQNKLRESVSWWAVMQHLVAAWRSRPNPADDPWAGPDELFAQLGELMCTIEDQLGVIEPGGPTEAQIELICSALEEDSPWQVAAVAEAVDCRCHPTFCADWLAEHEAGEFTPAVGELYPVPTWQGSKDWEYSRNPINFTLRPNEFPHIRAYDPTAGFTTPVEIVLYPTAAIELDAALATFSKLATVHPNREWAELSMTDGGSAFPVGPTPENQLAVIQAGVDAALDDGAQLVVVPELAVTAEHAEALREWLSDRQPHAVVVTGSYHAVVDGEPANCAEFIVGSHGPIVHRKIVPFIDQTPGAQPSREGIVPGPRRVRVLVGSGYRFATVICKDFLDDDVRHALARAGVNVVAVPAMSRSMDSYPAEVDGYVLDSQGAAAGANNPGERPNGSAIVPGFVFGQPRRGRTSVVQPFKLTPYVSIFTLGEDEAHCIPIE